MKKLIIALGLFTILNAQADIEHTSKDAALPTNQELSRNRACFEELKVQGCGDPGESPKEFRSCMSNAFDSLTDDCKKMMSDLYGVK